MAIMFANSFDREDYVLDVPFTVEEIQGIVKGLKRGTPDNIIPEHIIYGSSLLKLYMDNEYMYLPLLSVNPLLIASLMPSFPSIKGKEKTITIVPKTTSGYYSSTTRCLSASLTSKTQLYSP